MCSDWRAVLSTSRQARVCPSFGQFVDMKPPLAVPEEDGVHRFYVSCFLFILLVPPTAITVGFSPPKFPTTFFLFIIIYKYLLCSIIDAWLCHVAHYKTLNRANTHFFLLRQKRSEIARNFLIGTRRQIRVRAEGMFFFALDR